ncbi:hypothetical protein SS1G_04715 [Sclerotinia sclerotiorum 1980 UF-70]|uniref:Aminoacyl-tRNA synthetase class II (D/K/N) domain-containing protein n=1 Tax=Sclerotinia sclerotiorum (strain ATCC 18683 / 1980 / Ss-1) TaxID=665079 RepID=A7EHC3_SCLS1|nr:hypothetical protein SS1G_04715 [Sclerotinia sclerotiorum 1980 UF-70]EDO02239.1 hypothetical protein SS1G_04715 [Sclerotinia sclerotiorum 1980 UF-70]
MPAKVKNIPLTLNALYFRYLLASRPLKPGEGRVCRLEKEESYSNNTRWLFIIFTIPKSSVDPFNPRARIRPANVGQNITVVGFLRNKKQLSKGLIFAKICAGPSADAGIQVILKDSSEEGKIGDFFKSIKEHSAVSVTGVLQYKVKKPEVTPESQVSISEELSSSVESNYSPSDFEIHAEDVRVINSFPKDIIVGPAQKFGPDSRHLEIDMEMPWADGRRVMRVVQGLVKQVHRVIQDEQIGADHVQFNFTREIPRVTYEEAMSKHGSDKPDLRIVDLIHRVESVIPENLKGMLTSIENPIIEACKFRLSGNPRKVQQFIRNFMDSPDAESFQKNPDGPPGIFVFDPKRPLEGLQAFGFEGSEALKHLYSSLQSSSHKIIDPRGPNAATTFDEGDLLILQARPNVRHSGGSTTLVTADHYDLVVNGVELGGGSKRIHSAEVQKFIMKNVLKMSDEKMSDFKHLFEALRAGCPTHAGFAIGFDRWVAVLTGRESVRDVIFFPKGNRGEDAMVGSPGMITKEQEETYGLRSR